MDTVYELKQKIIKKDMKYRSIPFWAWNDKLEAKELQWQIQDMKQHGMGGFFIHSREGLETEYLSGEWMEAVRCSVEEAKKEGLEAWLYDEDKWPSGCAGGLVSKENPSEYTAKAITLQVLDHLDENIINDLSGEVMGLYTVTIEGNSLKQIEYCESLAHYEPNKQYIVLRLEVSGNSEWYNGNAPSDNLNFAAVKEFLRLTHDQYEKVLGNEFGKTVKGFFTDEPNFCDFFSTFTKGRPWIPWGENMEGYFEQKRGYSPRQILPLLFFDGKGARKARHDYWRTMTERFSETYVKQIYDWCDKRKLISTGHFLYENDLGYGVRVCGTPMYHYKYLHAPGIDILGEQTKEYLTVKQCTSVANQFEKQMVFTETYGCTGWDFTFEAQKWLGDWQFVLGVTRRCQHLALYSITGCRKRDYPPVFNYQTTWWDNNILLEDYFARLSACVTSGDVIRDILLLHPSTTFWSMCASNPHEDLSHIEMNMGWLDEHIVELNRLGERYNKLAKVLLGEHFDFDFGDELIMEEDAIVKNGKIYIKNKGYSIVIVPPIQTLLKSTLLLLEELVDQGGTLIWMEPCPTMLEGVESGKINGLLQRQEIKYVKNTKELLAVLDKSYDRTVRISNEETQEDVSILTMVRRLEDGYMIFAVNNDREHSRKVLIQVKARGSVEVYDPLLNKINKIKPAEIPEGIEFLENFTPCMSKIFFIHCKETLEFKSLQPEYEHPHSADKVWACLGPKADFSRTMENVLTLDICSYQLEENPWSLEMEVWEAQRQIREQMEFQQVYYNGAPQRYKWIKNKEKKVKSSFMMKFQFQVEVLPEEKVYAVIEKPYGLTIRCNGQVCLRTEKYFMDYNMRCFEINGLQEGLNELVVSGMYGQERELEDVYIIGDFAVTINRCISKEQKELQFGDWTMQGYFHYPGNIVYHFTIDEPVQKDKCIILKAGAWNGTLANVYVNGEKAGIWMGKCYSDVDISDYLKENTNSIEIEIVGSPRNMLGPFHQRYTGCSRISWEDFRTQGNLHTQDYVIVPYGLQGQITICEMERSIENDS